MRYWPIIIVFLFFTFDRSQGQQPTPNIDSLEKVLAEADEDLLKVNALQHLIEQLWNNERDRAILHLEELSTLSDQIQEDSISAFVLYREAILDYSANRYPEAQEGFREAALFYERAGKTEDALQASARVGIIYSIQGEYTEAEAVYRSIQKEASSLNSPRTQAYMDLQMGTLFHYQGITDSALQYYLTSIDKYEQLGDSLSMMRPMYNMAVLFSEGGQYEESLNAYKAIYTYQVRQKSYEDAMITLEGMYGVNRQLGRLGEAAENLMQSYKLSEKLGDIRMKIWALRNMGVLEGERQHFDQSKTYLKQALSLARQLNNADGILAGYHRLGQTYHAMQQYDSAAVYLEEGLALEDSLQSGRYTTAFIFQLGEVYADAGQIGKAEEIAERLSQFEPSSFDGLQRLSFLRLKGSISQAREDHKEVVRYLTDSYEAYVQSQVYKQAKENAHALLSAHKALGQPAQALKYAEAIHWLTDSISQQNDLEILAEQRKDFEFQLERQKMEVEQAREAAILKAQATQNLIVAIGGGLLALLGFGFFWNTRRKNKTIALQNSQLQQLNETKDRLFAIIGHDLRKPAIAFRGIAKKVSFLLRKKDFATLEQLGEEIEQDATGLSQLTENLLNWALTQRNVMPYQPTKLKLLPLLEDTAAPFQTVLQNKQIDLEWAIPEDTVVFSDANALSTIVRNLLDNAIKFTPEGGQISLEGNHEENLFKLKVRDTGVGIPSEKLKELFLLKERRTQPGTAGEKGSGLGLHLAHELSKLNQSSLAVSSQIGKGTIFTLNVPLSAT